MRKGGGRPPPQAQSKLGGGAAPLSFFPPSSSFPLPLLIGKGGVLLPVGVGIPPRVRHPPWPAPSSTSLYTGEGGTP